MKLNLTTLGCLVQVCPFSSTKIMISVSSNRHVTSPRPSVFLINFSWKHSGIWSVIRFAFLMLMFRTSLTHAYTPPEPLSWIRLALPNSVHYRIFFPSREVLYECISPSSLPQGKPLSTSETCFHLSPFRLWGTSPSAAGASQPPRYHRTRNFILAIAPIPEGRRQQRITNTSSSGEQCRLREAPQDHIIRPPLFEISLQSFLRLPNRSLFSSFHIITLPTLWPSAKA